jgi:hypothetical protein
LSPTKNKKFFNKNNNNNELNYFSQSDIDFDLFKEINKEINIIKFKNKEKLLDYSLNFFYGNQTYFIINLQDLENLINKKYINEGQAFLFWDIITNKNIEKKNNPKFNLNLHSNDNNNNNNYNHNHNINIENDFYLIDFIYLKSIGIFIFSSIFFLFAYFFQINFNHKNGGIISFTINFLLNLLSIYFLDLLYNQNYFFSSTFFVFIFIITLKYLFDFFFNYQGFNIEEYDILLSSLNKNSISFFIKIFIMLTLNFSLGFIAFFKYPYFTNYIIFYICLFFSVEILSDFFKNEVNEIFKPFRAFILSSIGISNILLTYFHKNNYNFDDIGFYLIHKEDSLYFLSDIFTAFCFCFSMDYINHHVIKNSKTIYKNQILDYETAKKISKNDKDKIIFYYTKFTSNDFFWLIIILFSFYLNILSLIKTKYSLYHISLFFLKELILTFSKYHSNELKNIFSNFVFFYLFITNYVICSNDDSNLFMVENNNIIYI